LRLTSGGRTGKSVFGVLIYLFDSDFAMQEKVICVEPYSVVEHNGEHIAMTVKQQLDDFGVLGVFKPYNNIDTVGEEVHLHIQGGNMISGLEDFEGGPCG